jgi:septum formation inhibitor MinC
MLETDTIQVMGRGTNVDFTIDDTVPFEIAAKNLRDYLSECRGLYSKGTVSVNVGRRILVAEQLSGIKNILDKETGLTVSRYWCAPEILEEALAHDGGYKTLALSPGQVVPSVGNSLKKIVESEESKESNPAAFRAGVAAAETIRFNPAHAVVQQEGHQLALAIVGPEEDVYDLPQNRRAEADLPEPVVSLEAAPESPAPENEEQTLVEETPAPSSSVNPRFAAAELEPDFEAFVGPIQPAGNSTVEEPVPGFSESRPAEEPVLPPPTRGDVSFGPHRGKEALIIKTTCRSGEVIRYPGDVVVLADVNPGAEIIAGGDIVVLGALRGMARAGAEGDLKSTIIAMNLESHRLQIGPHIGEAPQNVRRPRLNQHQQPAKPQIAYLRRSSIFVAPFLRRNEDYQGGILYEG